MKHLIIAAFVFLGLIAQSSIVSVDQQLDNGQAISAIGSNHTDGSQQLTAQEMRTTVGGESLSGCWEYTDLDGDKHLVCCIDLWIITLCAGVNVSAIERALPF